MRNKYLLTTIVVSNVCFWLFFSFGVKFWLDNRDTKAAAEYEYQQMQAVGTECAAAASTAEPICQQMAEHRIALDKHIQASSNYASLTRLFITFALFLPLISWVSYFLTRAIFN